MKLHTKTIFVLLGTLAIGLALGALGQSTMHNRRMEKLTEMRRQGGLYGQIDRYIDPIDQVQQDTLVAISHRHQDRLDKLYKKYRWYRSGFMDSLRTELVPVLDSSQVTALTPCFDRATRRRGAATGDSTSVQSSSESNADSTTSRP